MSTAVRTARDEASGWRVYVLAGYYLIARNVSLSIAIAGGLMIGFGFVFEDALGAVGYYSDNVPYYAGLLGIWGGTLVILGLTMLIVLFANAKYAEFTND